MSLVNGSGREVRATDFGIQSVGLAALAFIAGLLLAFGSSAQTQSYRFDDFEIEGAVRVEPGTILSYAGLSEGIEVTAGELNAAYQAVHQSQLFETVEFEPRDGTLVIRVTEYPTVNSVNFEGNRRVSDDVLEPIVQSQPRDFFNPGVAEEDAARITQAYEQMGRLAAGVDPVIIRRPNNRVDLIFEIREGRVSEVERIGFVGTGTSPTAACVGCWNRNRPDCSASSSSATRLWLTGSNSTSRFSVISTPRAGSWTSRYSRRPRNSRGSATRSS